MFQHVSSLAGPSGTTQASEGGPGRYFWAHCCRPPESYVFIHVYMCIYVYVYVFMHSFVYIYVYMCSYVYIYVYMYIHLCIYVYTYTYVCTYVYM